MDNSSAHPHSTVTQQAIREEREREALELDLLTTRLYRAALVGDVSSLLDVLRLDASILDRCRIERSARGFIQSPLHIAADLGHLDFVNKILEIKPELAEERDHKQGCTPLHLSAAKGHLEIVNALLAVNPNTCLERNETGRNPVHVAALKGQKDALGKLLEVSPQAAYERTSIGETVLHLCVKYNQLDTLKFLVEFIGNAALLNAKDSNGDTILHWAVATTQVEGHLEIVNALLAVNPNACLERNEIGRNPVHVAALKGQKDLLGKLLEVKPQAAYERTSIGETVLHLCVKYNQLDTLKFLVKFIGNAALLNAKDSNADTILHWAVATTQVETLQFLLGDERIEKNVFNADGYTARDICRKVRDQGNSIEQEIGNCLERAGALTGKDAKMFQERDHTWLSNQHNALMVVASLIANMASQVALNPPGGVWQDNNKLSNVSLLAGSWPIKNQTITPAPGESIFGYRNSDSYGLFLLYTTGAFVLSLAVICLLLSGLRSVRYFPYMLNTVMWAGLFFVFMSYWEGLTFVVPSGYRPGHGASVDKMGWWLLIQMLYGFAVLKVLMLWIKVIKNSKLGQSAIRKLRRRFEASASARPTSLHPAGV